MSRVLGIDPGSRVTGYGLVEEKGGSPVLVASGTIRLDGGLPMAERLATLYRELTGIVAESRPAAVAVERVFVARNADSALKLGHARGVVLLAVQQAGLPLFEYTPAEVKKVVTGRGRAEKFQVVALVRAILGLDRDPAEDEADALAIAMCHMMMAGERALYDQAEGRG